MQASRQVQPSAFPLGLPKASVLELQRVGLAWGRLYSVDTHWAQRLGSQVHSPKSCNTRASSDSLCTSNVPLLLHKSHCQIRFHAAGGQGRALISVCPDWSELGDSTEPNLVATHHYFYGKMSSKFHTTGLQVNFAA